MSNFHPDTGGWRWSLVQVRLFSRAAGREGCCREISLACVRSTCSVPATLGLPPLTGVCAFPSTLLRLQAAVYVAGPALRALPLFRYSTKAPTQLGLRFVPSQAGAAQAARSLKSTVSLGAACLLPSSAPALVSARRLGAPCVCSMELVFSRDPPGRCQPSRISGSLWLEPGSLFEVW